MELLRGTGGLRLEVLGAARIRWSGGALDLAPRGAVALAYVAHAAGRRVSRRELAFTLWPDSPEPQALTNLRHLLHRLRAAVPLDALVVVERAGLSWSEVATADVATVVAGLAGHDGHDDSGDRLGAMAAAVEAYRGDLLPGCWEDWVIATRDRLRAAVVEACAALAGADPGPGGCRWLERLCELDPTREDAARDLMARHRAAGEPGRAVRVYERLRAALAELGVDPDPRTVACLEDIVSVAAGTPVTAAAAPPNVTVRRDQLRGRDAEVTRLGDLWRRVNDTGRAALVLVGGEAGIGKSRLVAGVAEALVPPPASRVDVRGLQTPSTVALLPVAEMLESRPLAERLPTLAAGLRHELAPLVPRLADGPVEADPRHRHRLWAAVRSAVTSLPPPVVVVAEDVHWMDPDSLEVLALIARADAPVLVVATHRPVDPDHPLQTVAEAMASAGRAERLWLDPLDPEAAAALVADVAAGGGTELDGDLHRRILDIAGGHPLYLVEAVRSGAVDAPGLAATPGVEAVLASRLRPLSTPARAALELVAVAGRPLDLELLAGAGDLSRPAAVAAVDELERHHLLVVDGHPGPSGPAVRVGISHDLIAEVVRRRVGPLRRRHLHARLAGALEGAGGDGFAAEVAAHAEAAGERRQAVEARIRAARHAQRVLAPDDAVTHLRHARRLIDAAEDPPEWELAVLVELGALIVALRGYGAEETLAVYESVMRRCATLLRPPPPEALRGRALAAIARCDLERAAELGSRLAAEPDPVAAVEGRYVRGVVRAWQGRWGDAVDDLAAAVEAASGTPVAEHVTRFGQDPAAVCMVRLAHADWHRGRFRAARERADAAMAAATELGHPLTLGYVLAYRGWIQLLMADHAGLAATVEEGRRIWGGYGLRQFEPFADTFGGHLAHVRGVDATAGLRAVAARTAAPDWDLHRTFIASLLAAALLPREPAAARAVALDARSWAERHGQRYLDPELARLAAGGLAATDPAAAAAELSDALTLARGQGAVGYELRIAIDLAALGHGRGAVAEALGRIPPDQRTGSDVDRALSVLGG